MPTFKELLSSENDDISDQAQAKKGNWKGGLEFIRNFSPFTINTDYNFQSTINVKDLGELLLYKHKTNNAYVAGIFLDVLEKTKTGDKEVQQFKAVFSISFNPITLKHYKNCVVVKGVSVVDDETYQKSGISLTMYKYFVKKLKYTIVGDGEQYFGARKLWAKLSKQVDVEVDLYNIETDTLIEENVILHHGNYNNDFDKRLWSFSKEKINIRSILKDIL